MTSGKFFLLTFCIGQIFFSAFAEEKTVVADPLVQLAKTGNTTAQLQLGKEYFTGKMRPQNRALALYYFKLAADNGSPEGFFNLGMCYEYGVNSEPDLLEAYKYYSKAGNFLPALFKKAVFLEKGIPAIKKRRVYRRGIQASPELAAKIINDLIQQNYPPALTHQAQKYLRDPRSGNVEFKEAFSLLERAVRKNDLNAYRLLADCYEWGLGCEKDERKAFELLKIAADAGDGKSAAKIGAYFEHGIGAAPDLKKSLDYYRKAAELGEPLAMVQMAKHYSSGFIIKTDLAKALDLCQQALAANERSAFTLLGLFYSRGAGVAKDEKKAFSLFLKAAAMHDPEAQYYLALAFKNGRGTPQDESGAIYWMKKSAASFYTPAAETLKQWNIK